MIQRLAWFLVLNRILKCLVSILLTQVYHCLSMIHQLSPLTNNQHPQTSTPVATTARNVEQDDEDEGQNYEVCSRRASRGRGRGMVRGRGRGRGRGRRGGVTIPHFHDRLGALGAKALNFKDTSPPSFPFSPPRPVGVHLPAVSMQTIQNLCFSLIIVLSRAFVMPVMSRLIFTKRLSLLCIATTKGC